MKLARLVVAIAAACCTGVAQAAAPAAAQLTDFVYQGKLEQDGTAADGAYDLVFTLWDAQTGGTRIGQPIIEPGYPVRHGLFSINLAFDGAFNGTQTYLEVSVNGSALPRQPIATAPVAQFALTGNVGPAGPDGAPGPVGPQGPEGQMGPIGPTGAQGPVGEAGAPGSQGVEGPAGPTGATGPEGATGAAGAQGPIGPTGEMGPIGPTGADGPVGAVGAIGPEGPVGATGAIGPPGEIGPIGPEGPVGATGAQGLAGAMGETGPMGPAGLPGAEGPVGATGAMGPEGPMGVQGPPGSDGAQGPAGPARYRVLINGTLSTDLAYPLYPTSIGGGGSPNIDFITNKGYLVSIDSSGRVAAGDTKLYYSQTCSLGGPLFIAASNGRAGAIVGQAITYIVPKTSVPVGAAYELDTSLNPPCRSVPVPGGVIGVRRFVAGDEVETGFQPFSAAVTTKIEFIP